jgi:hypothetical protein
MLRREKVHGAQSLFALTKRLICALSSRRGGHDQCVHIVSIAVLTASICAPRVMIEGDFSPK